MDGPLSMCPIAPPKHLIVKSMALYGNALWVLSSSNNVWRIDNFDANPTPRRIPNPEGVAFDQIAATDQALYATVSSPFSKNGIFKLDDSRLTWTPVSEVSQPCSAIVADGADAFAVCQGSWVLPRDRIWKGGAHGWIPFSDLPAPSFRWESQAWVLTSRELAAIDSYAPLHFKIFDRNSKGVVRDGSELSDKPIEVTLPWIGDKIDGQAPGFYEGKPASMLGWDRATLIAQDDRLLLRTGAGDKTLGTQIEEAPICQLAGTQSVLFATTAASNYCAGNLGVGRVYRLSDVGKGWEATSVWGAGFDQVVARDKEWLAAVAGLSPVLLRSTDQGIHWQPFQGLQAESSPESSPASSLEMCCSGDRVFLTGPFGSPPMQFSSKSGEPFTVANQGLMTGVYRTLVCSEKDILVVVGKEIYRWSASASKWNMSGRVPYGSISSRQVVGENLYIIDGGLYQISLSEEGWSQLGIKNGAPQISRVWVDPHDPRIMIALSSHLGWSNDGGKNFNFNDKLLASDLVEVGGFLWALSDGQLFYVRETIPRPVGWKPIVDWMWRNRALAVWGFVVLVVLGVGSTRLILILLAWDVPVFREAARAFYITNLGRRRLFGPYRRSLLRRSEITALESQYVELPMLLVNNENKAKFTGIADCLDELAQNENIVVVGEGGSGKTTLCLYVARLAAEGSLPIARMRTARPIPVIVNGFAYDGDLIAAITGALKRDHAYVHRGIVETQLELGKLLILFDGYSEIPVAVVSGGKAADIVRVVSTYPDCVYLFTSRTSLPPDLQAALGGVSELRFANLDEKMEQAVLERYLNRTEAAPSLYDDLRERYPNLVQVPLMLRLAAHYYNQNGSAPRDRFAFFENYARDILSADKLGLRDSAGVHFAVEGIVLHAHIETGGNTGFLRDDAIQRLVEISGTLDKGYGITLPAVTLMQLLQRAGLFVSGGAYWKFFHDSFETYYAARVFEKEFRKHKADLFTQASSSIRLREAVELFRESLSDAERTELDRLSQGGSTPSTA